MSESAMQSLEAHIPELAEGAFKQAYLQALTVGGKALLARDGQLVEAKADGTERVIRSLAKPTAVTPGTQRLLRRQG
ncbi:hypothetical protein G3A44_08515 [Ideonella sp. TBM-1]|uniref:Uncharacterized protein n=1 Tax=Ideonella livida TaxID=2707176 RepID=A0A7C9PH54_9BURK|nr:hypothetical protein [Ideonella livida]